MTPKLSDDENAICGLLERYNCPLQFHEVRAFFMGAIACPAQGINPTRVIGGIWGGKFPEFLTVEDADTFFDVLINQLWNSLTAHQDRKNPFPLMKGSHRSTRKDLAIIAVMRTDEIAHFIEGVWGPNEDMKLPLRAEKAVRALEEIYDLISAIEDVALDRDVPKTAQDIKEMFTELGHLTIIAEKEIHIAIIACQKARKTQLTKLQKPNEWLQ